MRSKRRHSRPALGRARRGHGGGRLAERQQPARPDQGRRPGHRGGRRARLAHRLRPVRRRSPGPADPAADLRLGVLHSPEPAIMDRFVADGYDLLLAGHTHGGQVCLPGFGTLVTNCGIDRAPGQRPAPLSRRRPVAGEPTAWLHVSAGLGTSPWAPVRLCCRPEATLLTLVPRALSRQLRVLDCLERSAGCGAAWQRASFGTKRPPVQIRPPRPKSFPGRSRFRRSGNPGCLIV